VDFDSQVETQSANREEEYDHETQYHSKCNQVGVIRGRPIGQQLVRRQRQRSIVQGQIHPDT
jgi:hypothetical protein